MINANLVGFEDLEASLEEAQTLSGEIAAGSDFLNVDLPERETLVGEITKENSTGGGGGFDIFGEALDNGFARYNKEVQKFETILPDKELNEESSNIIMNSAVAKAIASLTFDWLIINESEWQDIGTHYRIVIPRSKHGCGNPYLDNMVIKSSTDSTSFENNIPTWIALADDSIVITSDTAIGCKVLIKGDK